MKKNRVQINESRLNSIIRESIRKVLREAEGSVMDNIKGTANHIGNGIVDNMRSGYDNFNQLNGKIKNNQQQNALDIADGANDMARSAAVSELGIPMKEQRFRRFR